jgi:hypothetical protein
MGKDFGVSIGSFLYYDVLIDFSIDGLLAVLAEYDLRHFQGSFCIDRAIEIAPLMSSSKYGSYSRFG